MPSSTAHTGEAQAEVAMARAYEAMTRATFAEMARFLQELTGQRTVALMVGIRSPRAVGQWARNEREPNGSSARHLRDAYQVAKLLCESEPRQVVQNWLMGMNPYLNDDAPALHIVKEPQDVLRAAKAFVAVG